MSDSTLNRFLSRGTAVQMAAFTPTPPTPASGPSSGYIWYQTDTGRTYSWDGAAWQLVGAAGGITQLTGDVTAGPGSGSQAATSVIPLTDDGNSGTALTVNFNSKANARHKFTLTGNVTLTLSNPIDGGVYVLLISTGAGGFTATWPAAVLWPGGVAPVITATASKKDLVTLLYDATAAKYIGSFNQNY